MNHAEIKYYIRLKSLLKIEKKRNYSLKLLTRKIAKY